MSVMNKMRKIFPMQQVDAKALEQKAGKKEIQTVYKNDKKQIGKEQDNQEAEDNSGEYEILEREILPEKIICPDCGGITWEGLDFCDKCGGDLRNL